MGKVMSLFKAANAKSKHPSKEAGFDIMYPTGIMCVDYVNGTTVHVRTDEINVDYDMVGIVDGTSNTIISRPGGGKSTLVYQILGNMMRMHPDSDCFVDDIESSLPQFRREFCLNLTREDLNTRFHFRNTGITTENVYSQIRNIYEDKKANWSDFEYDTGLYDTDGKRIFKLIPTFYFIDSFAVLLPNDINEDDEMEGSKNQAMSAAKKSTMFVKKIGQLLKEVNIILFTINHINDDPQMGPFSKPQQIEGLKKGERLPAGKANMYLANNMFRIDKEETLKETEKFGIPGSIMKFTICKSRTNANLRSVPLVFDKSTGRYDNELSVFQYLKDEGYIGGTGRGMYLEGYPDMKFTQKDFKIKLAESQELQIAFVTVAKEAMRKLLSDTSSEKALAGRFDMNTLLYAAAS